MSLPRGWSGLLFFWIGVVTACGVGAGTLQVLGPLPVPPVAEKRYPPDPAAVQLASLVPLTPSPVVEPPVSGVEASATAEEPATLDAALNLPDVKQAETATTETASAVTASAEAAPEPATPADRAASSPDAANAAPAAAPPDEPMRVTAATAAEPRATRRDTPAKATKEPRERKVQLRLVRDTSVCSKPDCPRWQISGDASAARSATVDLARLRLAPSLQDAADNGEVDLMIEAVERRRKVNGRNIVVLEPISLAGVMHHEQ